MRLPGVKSIALFVAFVVSAIWLALVMTAPLMMPADTLRDLSGVVGGHENEPKFEDLDALPHAVYWAGDAECHQIRSRSFFVNGNQMPFCARDVGLFIGLAAGFGFVAFIRHKINPFFAMLGLVPIAIDGGLQALTSYESNNLLRVVTGVLAGAALALILAEFVYALRDESSVEGVART